MNPERLAEPRAITAILIALVLVAALLILAIGSGATLPATGEAPITRERPDRLPNVAEAEAAAKACERAGSWRLGECIQSVLGESLLDRRLFEIEARAWVEREGPPPAPVIRLPVR